MGLSDLGCGDQFFVCGFGFCEAKVVGNGGIEQIGVLRFQNLLKWSEQLFLERDHCDEGADCHGRRAVAHQTPTSNKVSVGNARGPNQ
ncbi:hypothetical protein [Agrobacterium sp. P15N1-A]|uniref:hypothetical protein n=1 Tax=Agrobacterium sp. P15N1-A TaxID=3342820 RepID=UPI0037D68EBA